MLLLEKWKKIRSQILYTVLVVLCLTGMFWLMIDVMYKNAEQDCFEELMLQTDQMREDIRLHMETDRESLETIANFVAHVLSRGESYDMVFESFEESGLISRIELLLPGELLITETGRWNVSDQISYAEKATGKAFITGRTTDLVDPERQVIRSAVPVKVDGKVVAVLYGVIDLEEFGEQYQSVVQQEHAQVYLVEGGTGQYLIDSWREELGNISELKDRTFREDYTFSRLRDNIRDGVPGFSVYLSRRAQEDFYLYHEPVGINDWQVIISMPESVVFAEARDSRATLMGIFTLIVFVMVVYLALLMKDTRDKNDITAKKAQIREMLLELNQRQESAFEALELVVRLFRARSAFYMDVDKDNYGFIHPSTPQDEKMNLQEQEYLLGELASYAHGSGANGLNVYKDLQRNRKLWEAKPEFHEFLRVHGVKQICFVTVADSENQVGVLGVINPKKTFGISEFLKNISVCFLMSIYNKKHLSRTETLAMTDSLTGLSNRVAYNRDVVVLNRRKPECFACVYVDVNELHNFNNKYGHAAGDDMLVCVGMALQEEFPGQRIYRMGGDEYLVFTEGLTSEEVQSGVDRAMEKVEGRGYHISVGVCHVDKLSDIDAFVQEAERRMYAAKASYYQRKELAQISADEKVEYAVTGIPEIDAYLSIMSLRYRGVYFVSLEVDDLRHIIMPSYFAQFVQEEGKFSRSFARYVSEVVKSDDRRPLLNFLRYDTLAAQLAEGFIPRISYTRTDEERMVLSIYPLPGQEKVVDTIWVFEKENY